MNEYSEESCEFMSWAITYLDNNPNTTWEIFKNQFMGTSEGTDGDYDAAYWDDPNLTFPAQSLPTWANFQNAFPHHSDGTGMSADEVYTLVGGLMKQNHFSINQQISSNWQNACAIRLSRALNYSGIIIPAVTGTFVGDDNKNYFVNARVLNSWMRKTFGIAPSNQKHHNFTKAQGGLNGQNFPSLLAGFKGIFSIVSPLGSPWASGHADCLQSDGTCVNNCHFYDADINYIDVWELN